MLPDDQVIDFESSTHFAPIPERISSYRLPVNAWLFVALLILQNPDCAPHHYHL